MGQKIKIADLKKWDVFSFDGYNSFVLTRKDSKGFAYTCLEEDGDYYQMIFELEVELLGRMEYKAHIDFVGDCDHTKENFSYEQDFPLDLPN